MKKHTLIVVLIVAALLAAVGVALQSDGGGAFSDWLASLHGTPRH